MKCFTYITNRQRTLFYHMCEFLSFHSFSEKSEMFLRGVYTMKESPFIKKAHSVIDK
jgi:hypothetical protein